MLKQKLRLIFIRLLAFLMPKPRLTASPQRIVIIKPDHLGDVILLTPALTALRRALPHAHITVLVGDWATRLLQDNPDIDEIMTCPFPAFVRGQKLKPWQPYTLLFKYAKQLRVANFDTAIIARDDHWWGGLLAQAAGIGRRIGYAHPLVKPTLTTAVAWNPETHVTQQALDLVAILGKRDDQHDLPTFYPTADEHDWAQRWIVAHGISKPLMAIQAGSGGAAKLWLPERWAQVVRHYAQTHDVVLTGGAADAADVAAITALLADVPHHVLVGAANLGQLAALFARCERVLGVDNGPLHLAVTQNLPTIHLFGPGDDGRFGPWGDPTRNRVIKANLWCAPCGVLTHCPRNTKPSECMTLITVDQVVHSS